eukprot:COSAG05_NODE_2230_length_3362_cov_2.287466_6_plen_263_part_00
MPSELLPKRTPLAADDGAAPAAAADPEQVRLQDADKEAPADAAASLSRGWSNARKGMHATTFAAEATPVSSSMGSGANLISQVGLDLENRQEHVPTATDEDAVEVTATTSDASLLQTHGSTTAAYLLAILLLYAGTMASLWEADGVFDWNGVNGTSGRLVMYSTVPTFCGVHWAADAVHHSFSHARKAPKGWGERLRPKAHSWVLGLLVLLSHVRYAADFVVVEEIRPLVRAADILTFVLHAARCHFLLLHYQRQPSCSRTT